MKAPPRLDVVEIGDGIAARVAGRIFAGLGHDVVRIQAGTDAMVLPALDADKTLVEAGSTPEAEVAARVATADVVLIDGPPPGWSHTSPATLRSGDSRLVVVSITGFGPEGPLADLPADSVLAEAHGGLAAVIGHPDGPPTALGGNQAAHAAGFTAFLGAMLALAARRHDGHGALIEIALSDVVAFLDWKSDTTWDALGQTASRHDQHHPWSLMRAQDGWVGVVLTDKEWPALVELVGDPSLERPDRSEAEALADVDFWRPIVAQWMAGQPKHEVYSSAQRLGLPFGYAAELPELLTNAQYRERGFVGQEPEGGLTIGAPWTSASLGWRFGPPKIADEERHRPKATEAVSRPRAEGRTRRPLQGMVVLDLGMITAGAAVGRLLADYGATVIKVESPNRPDPFRRWAVPGGPLSSGAPTTSPLFDSNNAGKLSIGLDIKNPSDRAVFYDLVAQADMVIENFRVGVTERLGIDAPTLEALNPDLVYLSLTSQGATGPEARFGSYGSTLDLISGLAAITDPERPIWSSGRVNYPDQVVSLVGAALVVYCWAMGVRSEHLDLAQRELVTWTLADRLLATHDGRPLSTSGGREAMHPCGEDQWVAIRPIDDTGRRALDRVTDGDPGAWCLGHDPETAATQLRAVGVPAVVVRDAAARAADPLLVKRGVFIETPNGRRKGTPMRIDNVVPRPYIEAPAVGDHDALIRDLLGRGELRRLEEVAGHRSQ